MVTGDSAGVITPANVMSTKATVTVGEGLGEQAEVSHTYNEAKEAVQLEGLQTDVASVKNKSKIEIKEE